MKLVRWIDQLKAENPIDLVIRIVSERMQTADSEDCRMLAGELESLLREAGEYGRALEILEEMIERYPDDVRVPISGASLYLYYLDDLEKALISIDHALERAHRTGFFRREALGVKARILLQLGRGEELSDVLEEIMSLQMIRDIPDVGRERDFVDRAPLGLIRADVLARYNQFRPKRPGDSTSDEPPEDEPPDDAD
jgi:tetratricopeptide (TPR) repeat protein